jgi:hypothetical protein
VAYFHAGIDIMRSKSMDRNSYNSGDWFNRIDWTYDDNNFGVGAPPQSDNGDNWSIIKPLLANPGIKPTGGEIRFVKDAFRDLLEIRASSRLFRLRTGDEIKQRLTFHNTGSAQEPTVVVGHLDGAGYEGAGFKEVLYFVNVDKVAHTLTIDAEKAKAYVLHPVQRSAAAADRRPAEAASYQAATGAFTIPPRTAVVYVVESREPAQRLSNAARSAAATGSPGSSSTASWRPARASLSSSTGLARASSSASPSRRARRSASRPGRDRSARRWAATSAHGFAPRIAAAIGEPSAASSVNAPAGEYARRSLPHAGASA